jgi:hypothetical protein
MYTFSSIFHPFGGGAHKIVIEQEDGSLINRGKIKLRKVYRLTMEKAMLAHLCMKMWKLVSQ